MSIRMKAKDSFYSDDVKQIAGGDTFEVETEERAAQLEDRGLAERAGGAKAAPEVANKAEPDPSNKARAGRERTSKHS